MQYFVRRVALFMLFFATLAACPSPGQAQDLDKLLEGARAAQSAGDYAGATRFFSRASALAPQSPELWANRGIAEYLADEFDASEASLKHALQLSPELFVPLLFLGKTYVQTGRPAQALPYLNRAHSQRPNDAEVLLGLGKANAALNRQRQAAAFYMNATRVSPESAEGWLGLGAASLEVITEDGRNLAASAAHSAWAQALYGDELFEQGRPLEASETYKAALDEASPAQKANFFRTLKLMQSHPDLFPLPPNSREALQRLVAQLKVGQDEAALPRCASVNRQRQSSLGRLAEAGCSYWEGDFRRSATQSWQALRQSPQSAEALYWSVKANELLAVSALSRFEDLAPKSSTNYDLVGDLYRDQRNADGALSEYKKALAIDGHDPAAQMGAAAACLSVGKYEEAASIDQIALGDRPLDPQLNLIMAEALVARNHFDQAKPYLAKSLAAPPELQPRVHYLLGRVALDDGDKNEAIRQLELALPGDKDGGTHYMLSRLYRETGNVAQSEKALEEAKTLIKKRDANAVIAVREASSTTP
jgi:tetratricopeptide (TPR) repeat protein